MKGGDRLSRVYTMVFDVIGDDRGSLIALEQRGDIPFDIKRVYYMYGTTPGTKRGFHAHIDLEQVAVCVSGHCVIDVEHQSGTESYRLDSPDKALYMGGLVWREIRDFSEDCVLMVLASDCYSEADYIRDYDVFSDRLAKDFHGA